jgi:hypothetical protein
MNNVQLHQNMKISKTFLAHHERALKSNLKCFFSRAFSQQPNAGLAFFSFLYKQFNNI